MRVSLHHLLPPRVTRGIQICMIIIGVLGMIAAPFMPPHLAIKVINEVSMLTLVVGGLAGLDATRENAA